MNGGASTNIFTAEIHCHSVAFEGLLSMRRHTERESKNYFIQLAHAVGKLCGIFLTGTCEQLTVRYGETRRFPPHYVKGGNEERDKRLQVVELLTALLAFGSSFIFLCSSISFRIAFTVKRCVSAQKP